MVEYMSDSEERTSPDILESVFMTFREFLPNSPHTGKTILSAWINTFDGADVSQSAIFLRIGQISELLEEVNLQINSLTALTEPRKARARSVVSSFMPTVTLSTLHHDAFSVFQNCSVENCGSLGLLGDALRPSFSENILSKEDVAEILEALAEIKELLNGGGLPLRLQIILRRQIDVLIWRLKHPEFETLQQAADALGSATLSANHMEKLCRDESGRERAVEARTKLMGCLTKTIEVMERGGKFIAAGNLLYDAVKPILLK